MFTDLLDTIIPVPLLRAALGDINALFLAAKQPEPVTQTEPITQTVPIAQTEPTTQTEPTAHADKLAEAMDMEEIEIEL